MDLQVDNRGPGFIVACGRSENANLMAAGKSTKDLDQVGLDSSTSRREVQAWNQNS